MRRILGSASGGQIRGHPGKWVLECLAAPALGVTYIEVFVVSVRGIPGLKSGTRGSRTLLPGAVRALLLNFVAGKD